MKRFISNGYAANIVVVFAKTPLTDRPQAISAFILEKGMPGFVVEPKDEDDGAPRYCGIEVRQLLRTRRKTFREEWVRDSKLP